MENTMDIDEKLINEVKGFLDPEEGDKLYEIADEASKIGPCLEIGSYCGKSTVYLGTACKKNNSILYSIDHHRGSVEQQPGQEYYDPELYDEKFDRIDTFRELRNTIEKADLEDTVVPIVCKSKVASRLWATPLSMVFIDGGHSFHEAFTDYSSWSGHIVSDGYLIFHDVFKNPAKGGQAPFHVYKLALASGLFRKLPMVKSLGILKRQHSGVSSNK